VSPHLGVNFRRRSAVGRQQSLIFRKRTAVLAQAFKQERMVGVDAAMIGRQQGGDAAHEVVGLHLEPFVAPGARHGRQGVGFADSGGDVKTLESFQAMLDDLVLGADDADGDER